MKLNAPTKFVFLITVIAFVLGLIADMFMTGIIATIGFWVMVAAFALLALSCVLKNL